MTSVNNSKCYKSPPHTLRKFFVAYISLHILDFVKILLLLQTEIMIEFTSFAHLTGTRVFIYNIDRKSILPLVIVMV